MTGFSRALNRTPEISPIDKNQERIGGHR